MNQVLALVNKFIFLMYIVKGIVIKKTSKRDMISGTNGKNAPYVNSRRETIPKKILVVIKEMVTVLSLEFAYLPHTIFL
jgi:hypothetical protein